MNKKAISEQFKGEEELSLIKEQELILNDNKSLECPKNQVKLTKKQEVFQFLKFLGFSLSAGIIQISLFEIMYDLIHWYYWPSYLISLIASVVWNFTFNRKFTFKSANNVPIAMMEVFGYYAVFTPLSTLWGNALVGIGWNGTLVTVINMILNFITEFLFDRYIVFRKSINTNEKDRKLQNCNQLVKK